MSQFYEDTRGLLPQLLQLLSSFINRTHQNLAAGGVVAACHLANSGVFLALRLPQRLESKLLMQLLNWNQFAQQWTCSAIMYHSWTSLSKRVFAHEVACHAAFTLTCIIKCGCY
jgi:hypothetical protein